MASILQPSFHRLQDNMPCKQNSSLCFRQLHGEFVGWSFDFLLWGARKKRQEFPEGLKWPEHLVWFPPKLLVKLFFPTLTWKMGKSKQGEFDGVMPCCQELWCHETLIQGLVNALTSVCGEERANQQLFCRTAAWWLLLPAEREHMQTNIFLKMSILTSLCRSLYWQSDAKPSQFTQHIQRFPEHWYLQRQRQCGAMCPA